MRSRILEREYPRLRAVLAKINDPLIQKSLQYLDTLVQDIYDGKIEKATQLNAPKNDRNYVSQLHERGKRKRYYVGQDHDRETSYELTTELDRLGALCIYASYIADGSLLPVTLNQSGDISFPDVKNIFDVMRYPTMGGRSEEPVANDFILK